ncbi:hypothetical protein F8M41_004378 [Gigaspora margarita]|uniref:Uncharacterized protein n=1 Tax=Gigaspora margarita TaxID=4874 RepID=A0A8H3XCS2_GIGMA|nr:hypothetical protein F8M41_004378 [Gigaspora margarita]
MIIGYFPGHYTQYSRYSNYSFNDYVSQIPWDITHLNWIAFSPDDASNKYIPLKSNHEFLNKTVSYRNANRLPIFLAIVLSGNIDINFNPSFANGTSKDRTTFVTNVINFVHNYGLDGVCKIFSYLEIHIYSHFEGKTLLDANSLSSGRTRLSNSTQLH